MRKRRAASIALLIAICSIAFARNASAADFYAGKTIDFIVGTDAGGGFDTYARAIARHLARFLPGTPVVVVRNMPGAGSAKAAAYLYSLAPKDGTTIAALFPGVIMDPLLQKRGGGQFDAAKFIYLGSADSDPRLCFTGPSSKIKTFEQAMAQRTVMGATQPGASTSDYAYMHKNAAGAKFEVVSGYKGSADIFLAIERGEAEGACGVDWSSLRTQRPTWLADKAVNLLVQDATDPDPDLQALEVPNVDSFIKDDKDKKAVALIVSQQIFSRPYAAPPGVPAEQAALLRQAFAAVLRDPQFLADAEAAHLNIKPSSAERVQEAVAKLYAAPPDVVERARELVAASDTRK